MKKTIFMSYSGTIDELKNNIIKNAEAAGKEILLDEAGTDKLNIGFQRLGHTGGRWYAADIERAERTVKLSGEIKNIFANTPKNEFLNQIKNAVEWLIIYFLFSIIPFKLWRLFFKTVPVYIPLLIPALIVVFLMIIRRKEEKAMDEDFLRFMEQNVKCEISRE